MSEVIEAIGSRLRIRIIASLVDRKHMITSTKISRITGIPRKDVKRHLEHLVKLKWVEEVDLEGVKLYKLNLKNEDVNHFSDFLKKSSYREMVDKYREL